jgi:hypothetical protein
VVVDDDQIKYYGMEDGLVYGEPPVQTSKSVLQKQRTTRLRESRLGGPGGGPAP